MYVGHTKGDQSPKSTVKGYWGIPASDGEKHRPYQNREIFAVKGVRNRDGVK